MELKFFKKEKWNKILSSEITLQDEKKEMGSNNYLYRVFFY